ncbi:MAG: DUF262 domain-containing protein [Neisseriaceae bacterium]|nr:DUF262 domain-containing protein [Neisseriaceae bacterium]
MTQEIVPEKQSVSACLKNKKYYIDFYQREYVWSRETVEILLNDIMYSFNLSYEEHKNEDLCEELINKFNWYYLNVFITNQIDGKIFIVDGQQRLSTLTLIALYLYHKNKNELLKRDLEQCIFSVDKYSGEIFNLDNEKRKKAMECVFKQKSEFMEYKYINRTEQTIIERYNDIKKYFEQQSFGDKKIEFFTAYFLDRLVLVELSINKDDTPMVFEVINDRGEALKPFEILKGKLLGALPKSETEKYDDIWQNAMGLLSDMEDKFFTDFIKSKFVFKRNSELEKSINNEYHRYLFSNNDIAKTLGFQKQNLKQIQNIKNFLENDLKYYSKLYSKIRKNDNNNIFLIYNNGIHQLDGIYQNILSACEINDEFEDQKIEILAKEIDRLYVLLQLNQIYDSNNFQEISYSLNEKLKGQTADNYRNIFDEIIKERIKESKNKETVTTVLDYETFSKNSYDRLNKTVLKYLLARIEEYICTNIKQKPQSTVYDISTKSGDKNGYHIEHIFSRNETNKAYFDSEEEFEEKRNLIGALLLLKGRSNISSGNEEYADKLKTYSNGLVWGHTLCADFYHANPDFNDFNKKLEKENGVKFEGIAKFNKEALDKRTGLLFELVKIIWDCK